jgi:3-oxoacid CoA-transferase B subunit
MIAELDKEASSGRIARNVAKMINGARDTCLVNLGIGIPSLVANFITNENVYLHAENGIVGIGLLATAEQAHPMLINAGRQPICEAPGCFYVDSALSFGLIRGGHVDITVLGALEVDREGNVANWIIPNGKQLGVGGAMDLAAGANQVIVAMTHTVKGKSRLLERCSLPITGFAEVDVLVTEFSIFSFGKEGPVLREIAPDIAMEELRGITEFDFGVSPGCGTMIA